MSSKQFLIDNYYELVALQRVFIEAKFCLEPRDDEVAGSPIVANLCHRLINVLISVDVERTGNNKCWLEWLTIDSSREEWQIALTRAKKEIAWSTWSYEEKIEYTNNLLSPFLVSNDLINIFMHNVNEHGSGKTDEI